MKEKINWAKAIKPLLKEYGDRKHPLEYKDVYQLIVMVVLSARDTDRHINQIAPALFKKYPDFKKLAKAKEKDLIPLIGKVTSWSKKINWLIGIAKTISNTDSIPLSMEELVELPGIGRKSANVIKREALADAEGVMVDLHVVRVAPRLGIARGTDPKKIEEQLMKALPQEYWADAGMAISYLGREICRPKNPLHEECVMRTVCQYYRKQKKRK